MNTSTEAISRLQQAIDASIEAIEIMDGLIVEHDYQDVASLVAQAGVSLLGAARLLMQSDDQAALAEMEHADDLLDSVYDIIDAEIDDE